MISTGGTVAESITALLAAGARPEMIVAATHGLFVLDARKKLSHSAVRKVFVTDTVNQPEEDWPQLNVISVAPLIAGAVRRFLANGSLGKL
jgi:ribose-phosphate pyrophosphokinase